MLKTITTTLVTLAVGTAGGFLFSRLGTPLPWLLGAFAASLLVTVTVGRADVDQRLRRVAMPIMGVLIGSSFQPEILDHIARWPAGIAVAALYTALASVLGFFYLTRVAGWDRPTALCAAPPGGLAEMLSIGGEVGGDERRIILAHAIRIATVVVLATLTIRFYFDVDASTLGRRSPGPASIAAAEWLILGACAVLGGVFGPRLHLPGGAIFAAMILSGAVHITGLSHSAPPGWIIAAVQVVMGSILGVRFRGITRQEVVSIGSHSMVWALFLLLLALMLGVGLAPLFGLDQRGLFLATAPGGFAEMLLVAVAIGIESAFVATCHTARLIVIFVGVPLAAAFVGRVADGDGAGVDGSEPD
jgi:hypothetical protein